MKKCASVLLMMLIFCAGVWAQNIAQISGTVKDSSGAIIPGVEVTVTNTDTGIARNTISGATGEYTLPALPVGPYKLQASMQGFATYIQTGIVLQVNSNPMIPVVLRVGAISEQVEVNANAAMVETRDTSVGQVVDVARVVDLPLNGRQVTDLIALSGAAVSTNNISGNKAYPTAVAYSIAGGQATATMYNLDGGFHMDTNGNSGLPMPFPDALREFKVETSALPANYGNHSGGAVNGVTRSGTNDFHGDVFWFVRNNKFNATNAFGKVGPDGKRLTDGLKRNQVGAVLGGPIVKNKLFFFAGYQRTKERVTPTDNTSYGPTAAALAGDFSAFQGGKVIKDPLTGVPFAGSKIPTDRMSKIALSVLNLMPRAPANDGLIVYGIGNDYDEHQGIARVDWQQSSKNSVFFRYYIANYFHPSAYTDNILATTSETGGMIRTSRIQTGLLGSTYVLNPTTIISTRLGLTRSYTTRTPPPNVPTPTALGTKMWSGVPSYFYHGVSNYFTVACGNCSPGYFAGMTPNLAFDINLMRGSHQILTGFSWVNTSLRARGNFLLNARISFSGSGQRSTGNALADYMMGLPSEFRQSNAQVAEDRLNTPALYFQDNWKVSPRLSVNLGVRWDPFLPQTMTRHMLTHFEKDWFIQGKKSKVYSNAPAGMVFYGDPEIPGTSDTNQKLSQFSPRIGIVYDPKGNGQQTFRLGYGIFYETSFLWQMLYFSLNPPFGNQITLPYPKSLEDPWGEYPGGNPFPTPDPPPSNYTFPQWASYVNMPLNSDPPMTQQWNFSYQRQFGKDWMVGGSYMGNRTTHLWLGYELTSAVYIPGNCVAGQYGLTAAGACSQNTTDNLNARRVLTLLNPTQGKYYGSISQMDDGGNGNYHGLLLNMQKRMSQNISIMANYTLSHCLSEGALGQDISNRYQDPNNRHGNYGSCNTDRRQMFNSSFTTTTPKFATRWAQAIVGGWQLSTIFTAQTGSYGSVTTGKTNSLSGISSDRANIIGDPNLSKDQRGISQWFNIAAFGLNALGAYGNSQPGVIANPGSWNVNINLQRTFQVREGQKVNVRVEMFNALNHVNLGSPGTNMSSTASFGKITSMSNDPRIMQFALKYSF